MGDKSGSSWANSANLHDALLNATIGNELWLSSGNYFASNQNVVTESFIISTANVKLYGGFDGTEVSVTQRDWVSNHTIINGDIGTINDETDNTNRLIVLQAGNVIIDGLILTNANANGVAPYDRGGAIELAAGSKNFIITNCVIENNKANGIAPGIHQNEINTHGTISNSVFSHNISVNHSGAIYANSRLDLSNVIFYSNEAAPAGGSWDGGAITYTSQSAGANIFHCLFINNRTDRNGGAIATSAPLNVKNSIFWDNKTDGGTPGEPDIQGSSANVSSSIYQSGNSISWPGGISFALDDGNNSNALPMFSDNVNVKGADNIWFTSDDGFQLASGSPAINTGELTLIENDIVSEARFDTVDIGSYEHIPNLVMTKVHPHAVAKNGLLKFSVTQSNKIYISDKNNNNQSFSVLATHGNLKLSTLNGLTSVSGNGSNQISYSGNVDDVNLSLEGLVYEPFANYIGSDNIVFNTYNGSDNIVEVIHVNIATYTKSKSGYKKINKQTLNNDPLANGYGISIVSLGDIDRDGVLDIAVGSYKRNTPKFNIGAINVHLMNSDGSIKKTTVITSTTFKGPIITNNDQFGQGMANIGDLDGDGVVDLAVGAPSHSDGGTDAGALFILFLRRDGSLREHVEINSFTTNGPTISAGDFFGKNITPLGDLDGDGIVDIAVGAQNADGGTGVIHILFMQKNGLPKSSFEINSTTPNLPSIISADKFGRDVAALGDLDGDGLPDLIAGTKFGAVSGTKTGGLVVIFLNADGSVKSSQSIETVTTPIINSFGGMNYGISVRNLGDLDGDGIVDIFQIGNVTELNYQIFYLNSDGTIKGGYEIDDSTINTPYFVGELGRPVVNIGDFNGDGNSDFAVGASTDNGGSVSFILSGQSDAVVVDSTKASFSTNLNQGSGPHDVLDFKFENRSIATETVDNFEVFLTQGNVIGNIVNMSLYSGNTLISDSPVIAGNAFQFSFSPMPIISGDNLNFTVKITIHPESTSNNLQFAMSHGVLLQSGNSLINNQSLVETFSVNIIQKFEGAMSSGYNTLYGIRNDGSIYASGINNDGQMGINGNFLSGSSYLSHLGNAQTVAAGARHTLVLKSNGNVIEMGATDLSQTEAHGDVFIEKSGLSQIQAIFVGSYTSFALNNSNQLYAWGDNDKGQLGIGTFSNISTPTLVSLPAGNIKHVASGVEHTLVLIDSTVYACGSNGYGQLGHNDLTLTQNTFQPIANLSNIYSIGAGGFHSFAIDNHLKVKAWGKNSHGQLGLNPIVKYTITPTHVPAFDNTVQITGGYHHTIFRTVQNSAYVCGDNSKKQLGLDAILYTEQPQKVLNYTDVNLIEAGAYSSLLLRSSSFIKVWGDTTEFGTTYVPQLFLNL